MKIVGKVLTGDAKLAGKIQCIFVYRTISLLRNAFNF